MSKLTRVQQLIFAINSGIDEIAEFGSLRAGSPTFTTDPVVIQSLPNYLAGWFAGVIGNNSPAIEDMNALCFLFARQLAYIFEDGIPEWDFNTTYYTGSIVNDTTTGVLFKSITDNNQGNPTTDTLNWTTLSEFASGVKLPFYMASAPVGWTLDASINDRFIRISSSSGGSTGGAFSNLSHVHGSSGMIAEYGTTAGQADSGFVSVAHTFTTTFSLNNASYSNGPVSATHGTNIFGNTDTPTGLTHDSGAHAYANFIICTKN